MVSTNITIGIAVGFGVTNVGAEENETVNRNTLHSVRSDSLYRVEAKKL